MKARTQLYGVTLVACVAAFACDSSPQTHADAGLTTPAAAGATAGGPATLPPAASGGTGGASSANAGASGAPRAAAGSAASPAGAGTGGAASPADAGERPSGSMNEAGAAAPTPTDAGAPAEPAGEPQDAGSATSDAATEPREDLGKGDGSDVVTIGDSWMSLGRSGIQQSLVRVSGQPYRTYGVGGTRLLNDQIPNQYASAKREDEDIKTVVMTGGGNDIIQVPGLREDCAMGGSQCGMVLGQILDRLSELWMEMAADGVADVVYVQYSNPEGNNVDFRTPDGDGVEKRCAEVPSPLRCHRLETLDIVMGDIPDGVHPSAAGYDRIGDAVHKLMVEQGMRR